MHNLLHKQQVLNLIGWGVPIEDIAEKLGVPLDTIYTWLAYQEKPHLPSVNRSNTSRDSSLLAKKLRDFIGKKVTYSADGQTIWGLDSNGEGQMLLNVRGWGAIQNLFETTEEAAKFQDELGGWLADAINEKLEKVD